MMETHTRTIIKTVTWRFIAFSATVVAIYLYDKNIKAALTVGISVNLVKMFLYYLHERFWNNVSFGRVQPKQPEYQI